MIPGDRTELFSSLDPINSADDRAAARSLAYWDRELWSSQPYVGLRPFEKREWPIFCGRDHIVEEILRILGRNHFVFVIGASGSGKSSLVRAGVLATAEGLHGMVGVRWRTAAMRPGVKPLWSLAEEILKARVGQKSRDEDLDPGKVAQISIAIQHADCGLAVIKELVGLKPNENFLLLVDQFEELFRFETEADEEERREFVRLLVQFQRERPPGLYVVATMRAEFIGECTIYSELADVVNQTTYLVPPMAIEDLREAIARPAELKEGAVEPELVEQLLKDIDRRVDDLPILQHTLSLLWSDAEIRRGEENCTGGGTPAPMLTLNRYAELKGDDKSLISRHCDEIYDGLNPKQQKIAEIMFRRMVSVDDKGNRLRRRTTLSSVAEISGADLTEVEWVANRFAEEGACFVDLRKNAAEQDGGLDITHESLIRQWRRLADWQRAEKRSYETYKDLNRAVEKRRDFGGDLWSGNELSRAVAWRTEETPTARWARRYGGDFAAAMGFLTESENRELAAKKEHDEEIEREQEEKIENERIRRREAEAESRAVAASARATELEASAKIAKLQRRIEIFLVVGLILSVAGLYLLQRASARARDLVGSLNRMDAIALDSGPEFRRRLLVLRASLLRSATEESLSPVGLIQRRALVPQHRSTLATIKATLLRAPMFGGEYEAVGADPERKRIIALKGNGVEQYDLDQQTGMTFGEPVSRSLKDAGASRNGWLAQGTPSVGFLGEGVGAVPAAVRSGVLSYWVGDERKQIDLDELLPRDVKVGTNFPPLTEFDGGRLQVTSWIRETADPSKAGNLTPLGNFLRIVRFEREEIDQKRPAESSKVITYYMPAMSRQPIFSHRTAKSGTLPFATDQETPLDSNKARAEVKIFVNYGDETPGEIDAEEIVHDEHPRTYGGPPTKPYVFGLADNADALVFRHAEGAVKVFDFPVPGSPLAKPVFTADLSNNAYGKLIQPDIPFFRPIIAAAQNSVGWRFAWPSEGGIEVTEVGKKTEAGPNQQHDGGSVATPIPQSPLLSGSIGGTGLNFSENADHIILTQQRAWGQPIALMVWDIGSAREEKIDALTDAQAAELACEIAGFDPRGPVLTQSEMRTYGLSERIDPGCK